MKKLTKGSALVFSLIILTFLLVIAISVAQNAVTEKKSASTTGKSLQAFQVADSGSELFLKAIKGADSGSSLASILGSKCSGNTYENSIKSGENYKVTFFDQDGKTVNCSDELSKVDRIKSVGTYGGATRAVDVAVAASGDYQISCTNPASNYMACCRINTSNGKTECKVRTQAYTAAGNWATYSDQPWD